MEHQVEGGQNTCPGGLRVKALEKVSERPSSGVGPAPGTKPGPNSHQAEDTPTSAEPGLEGPVLPVRGVKARPGSSSAANALEPGEKAPGRRLLRLTKIYNNVINT